MSPVLSLRAFVGVTCGQYDKLSEKASAEMAAELGRDVT